MRIIGEFDIDNIKITAFKMNERISIKFESFLLEQTYKFRDGSGIHDLNDVKKFCSEDSMTNIISIFKEMIATRNQALKSVNALQDDEFDDII